MIEIIRPRHHHNTLIPTIGRCLILKLVVETPRIHHIPVIRVRLPPEERQDLSNLRPILLYFVILLAQEGIGPTIFAVG